jgi:hypothetical protein
MKPLSRQFIEDNSVPEPNTGCWLWLGSLNSWGYGRLGDGYKTRAAHRASFEAFNGEIPHEAVVRHRCDLPCCVNPDHLQVGSLLDNARDCKERGRHIALRGEKSGTAKLTSEVVADLRSRTIHYGSISQWAREFSVSRRAIRFVLENVTWK